MTSSGLQKVADNDAQALNHTVSYDTITILSLSRNTTRAGLFQDPEKNY